MKLRKVLMWCGLILLSIALVLSVLSFYMGKGKAIHADVTVGGILVEKLTEQEAEILITQKADDFLAKVYTIQIDGEVKTITPKDFDVVIDAKKAAKEAFSVGRKNFFTRLFADREVQMPMTFNNEKLMALLDDERAAEKTTFVVEKDSVVVTNGKNSYSFDVQQLAEILVSQIAFGNTEIISIELSMQNFEPLTIDQLKENYGTEGKNASFVRDENGEIAVLPEVVGMTYDEKEVKRILNAHTEEGEVFSIPVSVFIPEVTAVELESLLFRDVLSTYTSNFSEGDRNRCSNIRLASSKIHGLVMLPGEEFSYNQTVGERTAANGFGLAHAYVSGQVVDQYGGGICQVSSTLYNAQLFANLKTVERVCHMMTVGYVPLGRDATVDWGTIDYRFMNDRDYPIKIEIDTSSYGTITVNILGTKVDNEPSVKLEVTNTQYLPFNTQTVENPDLPLGEEKVVTKGKNTITCDLYRVVVDANGDVISRTFETKSRYRGNDEIKEIGTGLNLPPEDSVITDGINENPIIPPANEGAESAGATTDVQAETSSAEIVQNESNTDALNTEEIASSADEQ